MHLSASAAWHEASKASHTVSCFAANTNLSVRCSFSLMFLELAQVVAKCAVVVALSFTLPLLYFAGCSARMLLKVYGRPSEIKSTLRYIARRDIRHVRGRLIPYIV